MLRTGSSDRLNCNRLQPPESIDRNDRFLNDIPTHTNQLAANDIYTRCENSFNKKPWIATGRPVDDRCRRRREYDATLNDTNTICIPFDIYLVPILFRTIENTKHTSNGINQINQLQTKTKKPSVIQGQILKIVKSSTIYTKR